MRGFAMQAAIFWKEHIYPLTFDYTFPLPGMRVRMIIEKATSDQDTKPIDAGGLSNPEDYEY